ncbi:MAG: ATP-binding protein [Thermoflexales bacterium]|nr:ATP-binding protein [Thermoflexales bacterium]
MDKKVYSRVYESAHQQERERIHKFIEDIKNDLGGTPCLLALFGPRGFGKTAFLEQIWNEYERIMPTSLVRAKFCEDDVEALALNRFLIDIVDQLGERIPKRNASLPSDYKSWTNRKQLIELLLDLVKGAKDAERVTLLLIDDYDLMPEEQRRRFQEDFLSPASRIGKFAVVLTSETELRLTESFELRMRLECRELTGLDPEVISRALPEEYRGIAGEIHRITGGLPVLTEEFIDQLQDSQFKTSADFQAHVQEFTGKYYRTYVEQFVADLASDIQETTLILALLRRFDVQVLRKILTDLLVESYKGYGTADYLDLIDRLRPWVKWRRQGGYALNPAFRLMLEGYVLTIRPDLYKKVNRAAEVMYRGWLESEYREHYLIELLYHVLALYKAERANGLFPVLDDMSRAKVGSELLSYLEGNTGRQLPDVDLDALRHSLEQDPDLKNYISEDVNRKIQNLIQQRIPESA